MSTGRDGFDAFADDLRRVLDLSAGVADAIRPGAYDALAADLSGTLALDTGLTAALGIGTAERRVTARLRSLTDTERLDLRVHPGYRTLCRTLALAVALTDARDAARTFDGGPDRLAALRWSLDDAHALVDDLSVGVARVLQEARTRLAGDHSDTREFVRALANALERSRIRQLSRISDVDPGVDLDLTELDLDAGAELAGVVSVLTRAVDDFVGADLSAARSRPMVELHGVRWSSATAWPPGLADRVRAASVEVEPDTYVVTGDTGVDLLSPTST